MGLQSIRPDLKAATLVLSEEEKRLLAEEGLTLPTDMVLTKVAFLCGWWCLPLTLLSLLSAAHSPLPPLCCSLSSPSSLLLTLLSLLSAGRAETPETHPTQDQEQDLSQGEPATQKGLRRGAGGASGEVYNCEPATDTTDRFLGK